MKKIISLLLTTILLMTVMLVHADAIEYEVIDGWQYIKGTNKIVGYVGDASQAIIPENTVLQSSSNFLAKRLDYGVYNDTLRKLTISKNVEYDGRILSRENNEHSNLEEVVFAEGVTEIPEKAFMEFNTIKKVTLPSTLKTIGDWAFGYDVDYGPIQLEELHLPASIENITYKAFHDGKIKTVYVEDGYKADYIPYADEYVIEKMSADIFDCIAGREWTENVYLKGLTDLDMGDYKDEGFVIIDNVLVRYIGIDRKPVVPSNVIRMARYAFRDCDIETVTLPPNLDELAINLFDGSSLEYIEIPSSVKALKGACLARTNLKEIFVPKTVEEVVAGFAAQCKKLEKVTFEGVPDIGLGLGFFYECKNLERENVIFLDDRFVVPEDFWQFCMYRVESTSTPTITPTTSPAPTASPTPAPTPTASPTASPTVTPTTSPTPTAEPEKVIEVKTGDSIEVKAAGKKVEFTDVNPFVDENNRTQMPIRVLGETLGFDVSWNDEDKTALLSTEDTLIAIKIGENTVLKNGETIQMDTTAKVINDRTYIPLRSIAEAVGYIVEWK